MRRSIKAVAAERLDKKAFFDTMNEAEAMFAAGKYDEATEHLEDAYPEPANLNEDQQHALTAFEKKVLRTVSMNVCKALMDKARSTDSSDADAAFQAWDEASAGLQKHKANIDPFIWSKMNSEVLRERAKLSKNLGYAKVLKAIDDARKEGDPTRIMRALTIGMDNPLVPANVRESWKREIETIKVKLEFDAITRLLVEDREVEAIEALEGFTKKHPTHTKSANVLRALKIKIGNRETRKTALDTFASGNYAKALPLLQALRAKNRGDREINEKIKTCQFELAMVKFAAAEAAMNYPEAMKVGEEARMYNPDSFDARIAPRLAVMQAKLKVQATLADGEKALKEGRYRDVRTILKNLSGSYPAAARTIEKSRYRENLGKGHAARAEGDLTTAKAMYKIAKKYAKDPAELTEINTLISALSEGT
jgi:tetratricopeptide (TPR) repeat protein